MLEGKTIIIVKQPNDPDIRIVTFATLDEILELLQPNYCRLGALAGELCAKLGDRVNLVTIDAIELSAIFIEVVEALIIIGYDDSIVVYDKEHLNGNTWCPLQQDFVD